MGKNGRFAGQCHCGSVRFEAVFRDGFGGAIRCNCSICAMRGAIMVFADLDGFTLTSGQEVLSSYRFNTGAAHHHFCSKCGIYTHHQRRFDSSQYGVNVACLEGVSPYDFAEVRVVDGINHPKDVGGDLKTFGTLRFQRAE